MAENVVDSMFFCQGLTHNYLCYRECRPGGFEFFNFFSPSFDLLFANSVFLKLSISLLFGNFGRFGELFIKLYQLWWMIFFIYFYLFYYGWSVLKWNQLLNQKIHRFMIHKSDRKGHWSTV